MWTATRVLGTLALCLCVALSATAQQTTPKPTVNPSVAAVLRLADSLDQPDVARRAKRLVEEFDPCDLSLVFTLKRPRGGGVGIGSAIKAGHPNSIDSLVRNWAGPRPPTKEELQAHHTDLLRVARVAQAMAELAPFRAHIYVPRRDEKRAAEWHKVCADFKKVTRAFHDAIDTKDPVVTRKVAVQLQATCMACHKVVGR